jgi:hypothetical protein
MRSEFMLASPNLLRSVKRDLCPNFFEPPMCRAKKTRDPHLRVDDRGMVFKHGVFPLSSVGILRNIRFIGTQESCATGNQIKVSPQLQKRTLLRFRTSIQMCTFFRRTELFNARKRGAVAKGAYRAPPHSWIFCGVADNDEKGCAV